jgi:hypothetical protein
VVKEQLQVVKKEPVQTKDKGEFEQQVKYGT